jgi:hypothetical protein
MRYLIIALFIIGTLPSMAQPKQYTADTPTDLEWVQKDGKFGLYHFKKELFIIEPQYEAAEFYGKALSMVKNDNQYGIINHEGDALTSMDFDTTINFSDEIILAKKKNKFALIIKESLTGESLGFATKITKEKEYDQVIVSYSDDFAVVELGGKYGYIDHKGDEVIGLIYDAATIFEDGAAAVQKEGKWGAIEKNEKTLIPFKYNYLSRFSNGYSVAQNEDGKWGTIDKKEVALFEFKYDFLTPMNDEGVSIAKHDGKYGLLSQENQVIVPFEYDFDESYSGLPQICEGYVWLKKDGKWGTVNYSGKVVIAFQYDDLHSTDGDEARVFLGKKMQVIDNQGGCLENCD